MLTTEQRVNAIATATSWKRLRKSLFPDWKDGHAWQLLVAAFANNGHVFFVDSAEKRVFVNYDYQYAEAGLIHLLCHAVTGEDTHGPRWVETMRQVAERLRKLGGDWRSIEADADTSSWAHGVTGDGGDPSVIDWERSIYEVVVTSYEGNMFVTLHPWSD